MQRVTPEGVLLSDGKKVKEFRECGTDVLVKQGVDYHIHINFDGTWQLQPTSQYMCRTDNLIKIVLED